jgi:hypothetical protein
LAATIARHHTANVKEQLLKGGIVLWVNVPNSDTEKRAVAILNKMGAQDVHVHEIKREWGLNDIPFAVTQPDPFPEKDKYRSKTRRNIAHRYEVQQISIKYTNCPQQLPSSSMQMPMAKEKMIAA